MNVRTAMIGVLLLAGCTPGPGYGSPPEPVRSRPSPTASAVRAELIATLQRMNATTFSFSVSADTDDGGTVAVTGAHPRNQSLVIVGTDYYAEQGGDRTWVHLDVARVDPTSPRYLNGTDPSGLGRLITAMETANARRQPTGWSGRVDPRQPGEYLPVGAPAFWALATSLPFTVTVDGQGLVTSIVIEVSPTSGPGITMTSTFTGHGAPTATRAPSKGSTVEADESYCKK